MNVAQELLRKNLIQIDKTNPDFSELEHILNFLNSKQHLTIFIAYKQDLEDGIPMNVIRIDLNAPFIEKEYAHIVSSLRPNKTKNLNLKSDVLNFVKKYL